MPSAVRSLVPLLTTRTIDREQLRSSKCSVSDCAQLRAMKLKSSGKNTECVPRVLLQIGTGFGFKLPPAASCLDCGGATSTGFTATVEWLKLWLRVAPGWLWPAVIVLCCCGDDTSGRECCDDCGCSCDAAAPAGGTSVPALLLIEA
ncbi:hypothetical protein HaLaN_20274 [Haematococcus lacustris]|uniref:Uncharacterized protein n=1 Tax=Haematococcus lacustris TaxID=44745 RepID=A0A6A0A1C9_HAELA|nr:hypothetical protein HaLaN_20274 [Haematococcus lacustris]